MRQKFGVKGGEPLFNAQERGRVLDSAQKWGPEFADYARDVLAVLDGKKLERKSPWSPPEDAILIEKTAQVVKASLDQKIRVPDGFGGVRDAEGIPGDCLGPVLLHLRQNAWRAGSEKKYAMPVMADVAHTVSYSKPMSLTEQLSRIADEGKLSDWAYLALFHPGLSSDALALPYAAAEAVLLNDWGAREYSRLNHSTRNRFAPAYDKLLGESLKEKDILLCHSPEETAVGLGFAGGPKETEYAIILNTQSTKHTAMTLVSSANSEIPTAFSQVLTHKIFKYDTVIPPEAFKNGGTRAGVPGTKAALTLPETDFKSLTDKSGLSEQELAGILHRVTSAKLGQELARVYVAGGEEKSGKERADEYIKAFNVGADALLAASSVLGNSSPTRVMEFFRDVFGGDAERRLRLDLTVACADLAVLEEHERTASDARLKTAVQERIVKEKGLIRNYSGALGRPFDSEGLVKDLRKIHEGVAVNFK